jgi:hypothetical protein
MDYANGTNLYGIGLLSNIELEGPGIPVNDVLKRPLYPVYVLHGGYGSDSLATFFIVSFLIVLHCILFYALCLHYYLCVVLYICFLFCYLTH